MFEGRVKGKVLEGEFRTNGINQRTVGRVARRAKAKLKSRPLLIRS